MEEGGTLQQCGGQACAHETIKQIPSGREMPLLSQRDGTGVPIAHCCHADSGPPPAHRDVNEDRENGDPNRQEEDEQPHLMVAVSEGGAQCSQPH
ncbi:hypothetical protein JZ751_016289 [Albula glossodonta]|uniref:Uncharacterized protein n=1 Tax=Albula glossodonta TaxID=121402 RepID=A0A8T2ML02_9TELE|nr:hypothetical protein JZ751_016289 [Albula glossodonta]